MTMKSSSSSIKNNASSLLALRFRSTATTTQQEEIADISPPTPAEARVYSEQILEARIDRFREDMYAMPVFSPVMMLLTIVGFAGFLLTWGYFVATPVYLAHVGKSSEESGKGKEGEELD
jgi:hypothetical protein